jgi:hypothetical protein
MTEINAILYHQHVDAGWLHKVILRIYTPDMDALSSWQAPVIRISN